MKVAKFTLEKKDGLREAYIYVDNVYLPAVNNQCAEYFDDDATEFSLLWRIDGPPGSSLVVTMKVGQRSTQVVNSRIEASHGEKYSDFTTVSL